MFELPGITVAAIQSSVLAATSNLLAQIITAYQENTPLVIDWVPVFQFTLFQFLNTHPNVLWQEFLETTWPAHDAPPKQGRDEKKAAAAGEKPAAEPKLNVTNTAIKWVLDQTWGAAFNTVLFSLFIHSVQQAMARPAGAPLSGPDQSLQYLAALARGDVPYAPVDWSGVLARARAEFWPFVVAGWKLWPLVSVINFVFVKTVNGRNLVGSLAGVAWGVYLSLFGGK